MPSRTTRVWSLKPTGGCEAAQVSHAFQVQLVQRGWVDGYGVQEAEAVPCQQAGGSLDLLIQGGAGGDDQVGEALAQLAQHGEAAAVVAGDFHRLHAQAGDEGDARAGENGGQGLDAGFAAFLYKYPVRFIAQVHRLKPVVFCLVRTLDSYLPLALALSLFEALAIGEVIRQHGLHFGVGRASFGSRPDHFLHQAQVAVMVLA